MTKTKKATQSLSLGVSSNAKPDLQNLLNIAQLHAEKCELREAKLVFITLLERAKRAKDLKVTMEAISGLLKLSGEAQDEAEMERWDHELDRLMALYPQEIPPLAWYCKGAIARHKGPYILAQRYFHRYLKMIRQQENTSDSEEAFFRGWLMIATVFQQRGKIGRSYWLANQMFRRYNHRSFKGLNGILYLLFGLIHENRREYRSALKWYQKAHAQFLSEHHWYYHLYALYGYARLARHQQNYAQAYWYLDLVDQAIRAPEFGLLRREINRERARLEQDTVDLLIDSHKGLIKTRENGHVSLRKQYVLLHILEALSSAHKRAGNDMERGLSKAEIIEHVWKESYKPETHDNKLYYNINRLRKLIEPDVRKPQYLLNWKQGYRLAPGLRIHYVGDLGVKQEGERREQEEVI